MYDFDAYEHEDDSEWKGFLNEFMLPLNGHTEEDDDADPEYVAEPTEPLDKEELRPVRVSKKELNQLISELLEDSCNTMFDAEASSSSSYRKSGHSSFESTNSSQKTVKRPPKNTPSKNKSIKIIVKPNEFNTPPHTQQIADTNTSNSLENTPEQFQITPNNHCYSHAQLLQTTPQRSSFLTPTASPNTSYHSNSQIQTTPLMSSIMSTPARHGSAQTSPSILVMNQNQLEFRPLEDGSGSFNADSIMSQGYYYNGLYTLPQYQSVVIQIPTMELLQNGLNATQKNENCSFQATGDETIVELEENLTDDTKHIMKREFSSKLTTFDYLNREEPHPKKIFNENLRGFSGDQREIFEQQFRMHAQLLCQHYLQVYAHPKLWEHAQPIKSNLAELKDVCSTKNASHIENCIKLCDDWEKSLTVNNESNKKFVEFLYEEIDQEETAFSEKKQFKGRFHYRLMEAMLQSKAIVYTSLLPKIPFRSVKLARAEASMAELSLIAVGIEHAYEKLFQELNSLSPRRIRRPSTISIALTIIRNFCSFRNKVSMMKIIDLYKSHPLMNPIKYYYKHKCAPVVKHELVNVDLENIEPPESVMRGLLPKIWESYKFSTVSKKISYATFYPSLFRKFLLSLSLCCFF